MGNRPRIRPFTNARMDARQFVNSWSIRGWFLGAKVNALPVPVRWGRVLSTSGEELSHTLRCGDASALTSSPCGMPSILDKVFNGEL